ncbi:MAG TPA: NAD(P)H-hydrate dehydratase [Nitrospiraceae bacterium]|nr:NAD(P)H-hydrate dehydratase [Nitrospiraceae bacterium]
MLKIVTAAQMQALDRRAIGEARIPGSTLMERAGAAVVEQLERRFSPLKNKRVTIVCGKGNNAGDGFVVARLLVQKQATVQVVMLAKPAELSRDARVMHGRLVRTAKKSAIRTADDPDLLHDLFISSDLLVDALFGTGLSSPVSGLYERVIQALNGAGRPIVSVDIPSGLHADNGSPLGTAVRADLTVTFGLPKLGLYIGQGIDYAGSVHIADIGIPASFADQIESRILLLTHDDAKAALPLRRPSSHKGTYGHAGIIAGSVGKTGAAAMAAKAALRVGAGLVTVAVPSGVNDTLEAKLLEVMTAPMPETKARTLARSSVERLLSFARTKTAIAIGPGLTTHPETVDLIHELVKRIDKPCVLDADALNALAGKASLLTESKFPPILTPHPGEMARLETDASPQSINADRIGVASRFARERGVLVVLKGARTVVARPDGMAAICPTGNPGMATAGTGDVLTGMIAGLLAQGLSQWDAACTGTYFHGLAGDLTARTVGQAAMTAGDLIEHIPQALAQAAAS